MYPNISNKALNDLLTGSEKVKSFALQMKLNALRLELKLNKTSLPEATSNLLDFFEKNEKMLETDLKSFSKN
jgi:hypothetical protein